MIISKEVEIRIERRNITFYRNLGYELKVNTSLIIPINQLMKGAKNKILISCDVCKTEFNVVYKDYLNSHKTHNFDVCNKCKHEKSKITNNIRYGSDSPLGNKDILEKYLKTNNERYGGNSSSCSQEILDKQKITRIKKGIQVSDNIISDFKKYRYRVHHLTMKIKKQLLEKWDGYDYYDGEYIKENFNLRCTDRSYPSIDHKICIFYGFKNNIKAEEISKLDNLVITKRWINSFKYNKDLELFYMTFNKIV